MSTRTRTRTRAIARRVKLVDSTFSGPSLSMAEDHARTEPKYLVWDRSDRPSTVTVYTDLRLMEALDDKTSLIKIALLIEPPAVSTTHYRQAFSMQDRFTAILTHQHTFVNDPEANGRWRWYAVGGSRIRNWPPPGEKTRIVSLLTSAKRLTEGHVLRHEIVERLGAVAKPTTKTIDVMGEPYTRYLEHKSQALAPYMYSIVIENSRSNGYFTEKLIDCIGQATVPIYWGAPDIGRYFEREGMLQFEMLHELAHILAVIGPDDYADRRSAITKNQTRAAAYVCAEDWIVRNHPDLFESAPHVAPELFVEAP